MSEVGNSRIVVRGTSILQAPLLITEDATLIEFRDGYGDLIALMVRVLSDEMWGLVTKQDPDWQGLLLRYGYSGVSDTCGETAGNKGYEPRN